MIYLHIDVGFLAVYENDKEISCIFDLNNVKNVYYYALGSWDELNQTWVIPDNVIEQANSVYKTLFLLQKNGINIPKKGLTNDSNFPGNHRIRPTQYHRPG